MSIGRLTLSLGVAFVLAPAAFLVLAEMRSRALVEEAAPEVAKTPEPGASADRANVRLDGHVAGVGAVAFSGDGRRLVSGSDDHTVRLWDVAAEREIGTLRGHDAGIAFVALNEDGSRGLSSDVDGMTRLWTVGEQGRITPVAEVAVSALALGFTGEGTAYVLRPVEGPNSGVQLWDVERDTGIDAWSMVNPVALAALDDAALRLAGVARGNVIRVFDRSLRTMLMDRPGGGRSIGSLTISPDGSAIAYDSDDGFLRMVRLVDGRGSSIRLGGPASHIAFSASGSVLVSQRDALEIWSAVDAAEHARFEDESLGAFRSLAAASAGGRFATGHADGGVLLWDEEAALRLLRSGEYGRPTSPQSAELAVESFRNVLARASEPLVRALEGHRTAVTSVALSPDARRIVSGSDDGAIFVWDVARGARLLELVGHTRAVIGLAISPDGQRLVSTSHDGTTRMWSLADGSQERVLHEGLRFNGAVFNPDGSILATGVSAERATYLWNPATGDSVAVLEHLHGGGAIAYSPNGELLMMRIADGVVAWHPRLRQAMWQVTGQYGGSSLSFDRTGALLAYDARTHVALVDVRGRAIVDTLATPQGAGPVAFTPTDELVMASGRSIRVWDVPARKEIATLTGAMGRVTALSLGSDGTLLVAGSEDGAVWLWNLPASLRASKLGLMPWGLWDGPVPRGVGVHCDRRYGAGGVVTGVVLDSLDATPVDSAQVSINGCRVHTDDEGRFLFVGIDPGMHQLSAFKPGWQGRGARLESLVGDTTRATLRLLPKAGCNAADHPELPRIETQGALVSLRLDDLLQAALDSVAPGFVPHGLDTYGDWISSGYSLQCHQAPSAVLGDFNADGVSDLAAAGRSDGRGVSLVLISSPEGYLVAAESRSSSIPGAGTQITYYVRAEPGVIDSPMELDSLVLTGHGLHVIIEEKASTLFYWRDGQWREYVTGD